MTFSNLKDSYRHLCISQIQYQHINMCTPRRRQLSKNFVNMKKNPYERDAIPDLIKKDILQ